MRVLAAFVVFNLLSVAAYAGSTDLQGAIAKARHHGIDSAFLSQVTNVADAAFVAKAVRINITNFAKAPDYSWSWNSASVASVKDFMKANDTLLNSAQRKYRVAKEVIASILWIESRCGKITGTYHVPSVFLSVLMSNDSVNVDESVARVLSSQNLDSSKADSIRTLIVKRAERKANWARKELLTLQNIHRRKVMDVPNLHGSWAGAFGFPQFLPSSYNAWAVDGNGDGVIDLYNVADAAKSIGNYLHTNGWGRTTQQHRKAVYHYNNSKDYVDAVFKLAKLLSKHPTKKKKRR